MKNGFGHWPLDRRGDRVGGAPLETLSTRALVWLNGLPNKSASADRPGPGLCASKVGKAFKGAGFGVYPNNR